MERIHALDLNLLVALDALLSEQSVTRAAHRVGLSQPAMSHALGRLREHFGDPILVRSGRSMVMTPRAEALRGPLRETLEGIEALLEPPGALDPSTLEHTFTVVADDFVQLILLPHVIGRLSRTAPGVDFLIHASSGPNAVASALADPAVDLALVPGQPEAFPDTVFAQRLVKDPFVCVVSQEHPSIRASPDLETYTAWPHILVSFRGDAHGLVDVGLREHGLERRIAVVVPNFMSAPMIAATTPYILTIPRSIAHYCQAWLPIRVLELPISLRCHEHHQVWHERTHSSVIHQWLRQELKDGAEDLGPNP